MIVAVLELRFGLDEFQFEQLGLLIRQHAANERRAESRQ